MGPAEQAVGIINVSCDEHRVDSAEKMFVQSERYLVANRIDARSQRYKSYPIASLYILQPKS
jgi:hypothetical protein